MRMISSLETTTSPRTPTPRTPKKLKAKLLEKFNSPLSSGSHGTPRTKTVSPFWNCSYNLEGSTSFAKKEPSDRMIVKTSIKKQNEKSIRDYKKKNILEKKVPHRVPSRGMSILTKPPMLADIVADNGKEHEESELSRSLHDRSIKDTRFAETDESDLRMIRKALKKNAFFNRIDSADLIDFVDAFEHINVPKGFKFYKQGDPGEYFYIVGKGSNVEFRANGVKIGEAGEGESFGELSLIYSCPQAATVVAKSSPTDLFRVDRKTFKSILKKQTKSKGAKQIRLLRKVDFLSEMSEYDLKKLGRAMTPVVFKPDNVIVRKGEKGDSFYIINEGQLRVTDISIGGTKFEDKIIGRGDYFGERFLATHEPTAANVVALTKGFGFRIDRKTFERVLGKFQRVIVKAQDRKILEGIRIFESPTLTKQQFEELASLIVDKTFRKNETIFSNAVSTNAALYLVREGTVALSRRQQLDLIKPGAYFGEDLLLLDTEEEEDSVKGAPTMTFPRYTAVAKEDCICGVLSLSDCRTIFETTKIKGVRPADGLEVLAEEESTQATEESEETLLSKESSVRDVPFSEEFSVRDVSARDELVRSGRIRYSRSHTRKSKKGKKMQSEPHRQSSNQWLKNLSKTGLRMAVQENIKLTDLNKQQVLGKGQFGEVVLVSAFVSLEYGQHLFALKTQKKNDSLRGDSVAVIKREIDILSKMDHPYIVNIVHCYENPEEMHILMGAVYGGELFDVIHTENSDGTWSSGLPESDAKFYAMVITDTLDYIHRKQFIYRDLKPENVLIDEDGYPILCDFGFAKFVEDKTYTLCGTPNYLSPEIIMNVGHNASTDHWALGILIYEMVAGENPFYYDGISQMDLLKSICGEKFYPLPDSASDEVFRVVDGLLRKDPTVRLGSKASRGKEIIAQDWFRGLKLDHLRQKKLKAPYIPDNKTMDRVKLEALTASVSGISIKSNVGAGDESTSRHQSSRRESGFRSSTVLY